MEIEIQRLGATARAMGKSEIDNPYFAPDAVPAATGEAVESWAGKVEQWQLGWAIEDSIRH